MGDVAAKNKWNKIYQDSDKNNCTASQVLFDYSFLLPVTGKALDLACGQGGNAMLLAKAGLETHAWDLSEQAIEQLLTQSKKEKLKISTSIRDVVENPPESNEYDVICVSYFLDRSIAQQIVSALKPNGLLFFQTFIHEKVSDFGPSTPDYRLNENELLHIFNDLHVLVYNEHGNIGDVRSGIRNIAMLVAQKRE